MSTINSNNNNNHHYHNDHNHTKEKVRIELYAHGLPSGAGAFRHTCDAYAIVTLLANHPQEQPRIIGRTEVIPNTNNPRWVKYFDFDFDFTKNTRINVGVYDEVRNGQEVILGSAVFEIGEVLGSKANVKAKKLRKAGSIFARVSTIPKVIDKTFDLQIRGIDLKNMNGIFSLTDPFFELSTQVAAVSSGKAWYPVYRSEHIDKTLSPTWGRFKISTTRLCNGDYNQPIQFNLFNYHKNGKHTYMGGFETSVNGLLNAAEHYSDNDDNNNVPVTGVSTATLNTYTRNRSANEFVVAKSGKPYGKIGVVIARIIENYDTTTSSRFSQMSLSSSPSHRSMETKSDSEKFPRDNPPFSHILDSSLARDAISFSHALDTEPPVAVVPPPEQSRIPSTSSVPFEEPKPTDETDTTSVGKTGASTINTTTIEPVPREEIRSESPPPAYVPHPYIPVSPMPGEGGDVGSSYYYPPPPFVSTTAPPQDEVMRPKFVDYLVGGCEIELLIAIDFTGSNGDPRQPGTLHYIHQDGTLNDYEKAITAVGSIIARYDTDQRFPVLGFGAKYGGVIQHCFQVGNAPELIGLSGVLQAYRQVFRSGLTMSGPTVFSEVIDYAADVARAAQEHSSQIGKQSYRILLIITDGAVTDVEQTKRSLKNASDAPLSVVIVGVGSANFTSMHHLDDFHQNDSNARDICNFVEFTRYTDDKSALVTATLKEIPDQLVDYFTGKGIIPMPPISTSQLSLCPSDVDDDDADLNMVFTPDGKIQLANNNGAVYNDSQYGTYNSFVPSTAPSAPAGPSAPFVPGNHQSLSYRPSSSSPNSYKATHQSVAYNNSFNQSSSSLHPSESNPNYFNDSYKANHFSAAMQQVPLSPYRTQPVAPSEPTPPLPSQERIFRVQVPPNASAGMQLRIQNPFTNQLCIVTIPEGVPPGGTFAVQG